jgi:predicted transcriptional regulator
MGFDSLHKTRKRNTGINMDDLLSASVVAKQLGCVSDYISKLCREGKLEGVRVSNMWFITKTVITEYECERAKLRAIRIKKQVNEMHEIDHMRLKKIPRGINVSKIILR